MRIAYRRELAEVAAIDVSSANPLAVEPAVSAALADLAGAALEAGLAIARAETPATGRATCDYGHGKCGARELNYVSDVDVIYVAEPPTGSRRALPWLPQRRSLHVPPPCVRLRRPSSLVAGRPNLRPEGKDGCSCAASSRIAPTTSVGPNMGVPGPAQGENRRR